MHHHSKLIQKLSNAPSQERKWIEIYLTVQLPVRGENYTTKQVLLFLLFHKVWPPQLRRGGWGKCCCTAVWSDREIAFISSQNCFSYWPFQKCWCLSYQNAPTLLLIGCTLNALFALWHFPSVPCPFLNLKAAFSSASVFWEAEGCPRYSMNLDTWLPCKYSGTI